MRLAERAAQWFGAVQEDASLREPLFAWLAESPRNVEAFLSVLSLAQEIAALPGEAHARLDVLADDVRTNATVGNVVSLGAGSSGDGAREASVAPASTAKGGLGERGQQGGDTDGRLAGASQRPRRTVRWKVAASLAAGVLLAAAAGWMMSDARGVTYVTAVGEQRIVQLADGSVVHLNTDSRLRVKFSVQARDVQLIEGQALFKVEGDPQRPFVVRSGSTAIKAIGTQFDVYRRDTQTRVAVIEGSVQISDSAAAARLPGTLAAGESAEVGASGKITRQQLDTIKVTAWRQRRLVFQEDSLADIAADFNRYNSTLRITVVGRIAHSEHFSGTFEADAPETLIQALSGDDALIVERNGRDIVIRER